MVKTEFAKRVTSAFPWAVQQGFKQPHTGSEVLRSAVAASGI